MLYKNGCGGEKRNIFILEFLHPSGLRTFSAYIPPFHAIGDQGTRSSSLKILKNVSVLVNFYEIKHHRHCPYGKHSYYPQS